MQFSNSKQTVNGLLQGLNFHLPHVSRSQTKFDGEDMVVTVSIRGRKRKSDRYSIDISGLYKKNENWTPAVAAIGNDKAKNLFLIFDEKSISESVAVNTTPELKRMLIMSKAMVLKIFTVLHEEMPTADDCMYYLKFKCEQVNNNVNYYRLVPIKAVLDLADGKPPRVKEKF